MDSLLLDKSDRINGEDHGPVQAFVTHSFNFPTSLFDYLLAEIYLLFEHPHD